MFSSSTSTESSAPVGKKDEGFGDANLLPEVFPVGKDSSALPIFLKEPQDTFVTKTKSADVSCRVAHALSVHFQCNSVVSAVPKWHPCPFSRFDF